MQQERSWKSQLWWEGMIRKNSIIWPLTIWQFSQSNMICNMFQPLSKCPSILHFRCRCVFVLILLHGTCPLKCCHCSNSIVDHYTTIGWKLNCGYAPVTLKVSISVLLDCRSRIAFQRRLIWVNLKPWFALLIVDNSQPDYFVFDIFHSQFHVPSKQQHLFHVMSILQDTGRHCKVLVVHPFVKRC